jgi:hypothetical protein
MEDNVYIIKEEFRRTTTLKLHYKEDGIGIEVLSEKTDILSKSCYGDSEASKKINEYISKKD